MNRFIQTILIVFIASFTALCQERDTVVVEQDSIYQFEDIDSIFNARDPDLYATRRRAADSLHAGDLRADSLLTDSLIFVEAPAVRSPTKALMFALVLPGLGQAYNQKYWKMPIVWGAVGVAAYAIGYNTREYKGASSDYAQNPDDLNQKYLEFWRRNMELSYIALIAIYALQVLDAYVDAQLYSWDVNENLSLRLSPSLQPLLAPNSLTGQSYGFTCSFNIRGR